jgi:hypothetical protein
MDHNSAFQLRPNCQASAPFFTKLPGEIRDAVYREALASHEDASRAYPAQTSHHRPGHQAPIKTDCALLQTCQRVHDEAWAHAWAHGLHTFWLAGPPSTALTTFAQAARVLHARHGVDVPVDEVQIFWQPSCAARLHEVLHMAHFRPRRLTLTVRHQDWAGWEDDERLGVDGQACAGLEVPCSVGEVSMQLESVRRKREQVDWVAERMVEGWWLRRQDGVVMRADPEAVEVRQWGGSSTWDDQRWIRDEVGPDTLEYYVRTVVWRPDYAARPDDLDPPEAIWAPDDFPVIRQEPACLNVYMMGLAGVPSGAAAQAALRMVREWKRRWHVCDMSATEPYT